MTERSSEPTNTQPPTKTPSPEDPAPGQAGRARRHPARRRKLATSAALALFGLALLPATVWVWPNENEPSTPPSIYMSISTSLPINLIKYVVIARSPTEYQLQLLLQAPSVSSNSVADVSMYLPDGWRFGSCSRVGFDSCQRTPIASQQGYYPGSTGEWLMKVSGPSLLRYADLDINIWGASFGYTTNGVQESVAMPQIAFNSNAICQLAVVYQGLPNPEKYDWSSYPTDEETSAYASWVEQITGDFEAGRVVVGIDDAAQSRDNLHTFVAGALVALIGAALIGALQESLHLWAEGRDGQAHE